ncbi:hypothetical protein FA15DRAFT_593397 [Coprinopsis marcescibilis]|uniref:F-box domain-containing protein n=1 Tax=Coprinopsis marcescibilis TaxID=230819 RepID=A0A5C3L6M9_COPMA|nr:hypothetical protein FA15DRAFT_593397 [Coprinopsis marcescibilis]
MNVSTKAEPRLRSAISKANLRRRSLKTIFSLRPSSSYNIEGGTTIGYINADILREIADYLPASDILSLSLTSRQLQTLLQPALYETVVLKSSKSCRKTLRMFQNNRHLCQHIKKFAVRPNYYLSWPQQDETLDENWVVDRLVDLSKDFVLLTTFDWDGLELPNDRLWDHLRLNCPLLKSVFTNVGEKPLEPESALFSFDDLIGLSIIVRHGLSGSDMFPLPEKLPPRLWDMILNRCPNLEELAICSFSASSRIFDFDRVTEGNWPSLNSITLGSFGYNAEFNLGPSSALTDGRLCAFLEAHTSIKYIRFLWNFKRWMSPDEVVMANPKQGHEFSPRALPALETYIGIHQQLSEFPTPSSIETLDLTCEPLYESRLTSVCDRLSKLTKLTSLDLWIQVLDSPNRDHTCFFRAIVLSCPNLTDLHIMCTTSFSVKPLKQLLVQLKRLTNLKRFSLTKGHKYLDEAMLETAVRVIKDSPRLKQVTVRWARETCPNHLKQEGVYDVVCDRDGHPESLMVVERGIPLVGPAFRRRYTHKLPVLAHQASVSEFHRSMTKSTRVVRKRMSSIWSVTSV